MGTLCLWLISLAWAMCAHGFCHALCLGKSRPTDRWASSTLSEEVEACMQSPYLSQAASDRIVIAPNITYMSDLLTLTGVQEYARQERDFTRAVLPSLGSGAKYATERVYSEMPLVISVLWNVTFTPDSVEGLVLFSKLFGLQCQFYNLLDREGFTSSFSWKQLFGFLTLALSTGVLRLPQAVVKGQSTLEFTRLPSTTTDKEGYVLVRQKESLNLVRSLLQARLKNRVLTTHLLHFLSSRRPLSIAFEDWEDIIFNTLPYRNVPGMRQFEIDGLEQQQTVDFLEKGTNFLGFVTSAVLLFGVTSAFSLLNRYIQPPFDSF